MTEVPETIELRSSGPPLAGFMAGAFSWVSTSITPGTARAAAVSMAVMRPRAIVECTSAACASPG
ncbi:hypothetical protein GCM10020001_036560 [Nonomuraea salmonea]